MDEIFQYIFHWKWIGKNQCCILKKYNFEPIGNSVHTTGYLAFGKDLLARLYLTVKVYITKWLGVYIIYDKSHALKEVILFGFLHFWGFLWPWKLTFIEHWIIFNSPILFPEWLT